MQFVDILIPPFGAPPRVGCQTDDNDDDKEQDNAQVPDSRGKFKRDGLA